MGKLVPYAGKDDGAVKVERSTTKIARIDIRLTPEQRSVIDRVVKKKYRTITNLFIEWCDILERENPE